MVFTQLKCYSSVFSFKSPEIQKALINFFCQYLEYHSQIEHLTFKFTTNTSLSRNEKLLHKWIVEQPPIETGLVNLCTSKISQIIIQGIDEIKNNHLNKKKLNLKEKEKLETDFERLASVVQDRKLISDFVSKIRWEFGNKEPEQAVGLMLIKIKEELGDPIFERRPPKLLLDIMLSEIYRRSQLSDPKQRKVNNSILKAILETKDEELSVYLDTRLIALFDLRIEILETEVTMIKETLNDTVNEQKEHRQMIEQIVQDSFSKK